MYHTTVGCRQPDTMLTSCAHAQANEAAQRLKQTVSAICNSTKYVSYVYAGVHLRFTATDDRVLENTMLPPDFGRCMEVWLNDDVIIVIFLILSFFPLPNCRPLRYPSVIYTYKSLFFIHAHNNKLYLSFVLDTNAHIPLCTPR